MIRREAFNSDLYPRMVDEYIFEVMPGWFTFIDETGGLWDKEYPSIEEAKKALNNYSEYL